MPEPNRANWVGVRPISPEEIFTTFEPPYGTTYVRETTQKTNGSVDFYTVPADSMLYLTTLLLASVPNVAGTVQALIMTPAHASWIQLGMLKSVQNDGKNITFNFSTAIQVPEDYYFRLLTSAGDVAGYISIIGYLRSV